MVKENKQIVSEFYEAANNRDAKALSELLDVEVKIYQSELLPWGGRFQGHPGFISYAFKMLESIESKAKLGEIIEAGDQVVARGLTEGRVKSNGKTFQIRFVHIWTIKNEKLTSFEVYVDTPEMLRMLKSEAAQQ